MKYLIKNINDYNNDTNNKQSIIGIMLLDELLKENNIKKEEILFNENGKPFFKNNNIYFNISHSHEYVITVISENEIGIDIEKIRKININTINKFTTSSEKKYILSSKEEIEKRFFLLYTLKEAYIKLYGKRITDLLTVEFIIDENNNITCSDKDITCGTINEIEGYIISYCEKKRT